MREDNRDKRIEQLEDKLAGKKKEFPEATAGVSTDYATAVILDKARREGVETAWDRAQSMKPCPIGKAGVCCNTCSLGPCRVMEDKPEKSRGICGASVPTIVARNFGKMVAQGTACHSDHGRHIAETFNRMAHQEIDGYEIKDVIKMYQLAQEMDITIEGKTDMDIAREVGKKSVEQYSMQEGEAILTKRAPEKRKKLWRELGIMPRGVDREVVELMHRTNMGMDQDYRNLMRQTSRTAMADGWTGCMLTTELQDIMFGTPIPRTSSVNFGALEHEYVNIVVHGHEPLLSEPLVEYALSADAREKAKSIGAKGVNVVGMCCTANEMLVRHGVPIAGNYAQQELVMATGVVDGMVVDYQCVQEGLQVVAEKYHTRLITTSPKCRIPGADYIEFDDHHVKDTVKEIVQHAIDNYKNRVPEKVHIPDEASPLVAGFSFETVNYMLGGSFRKSFRPLNDAIIDGRIKGVAGVVGCDAPQIDIAVRASASHEELVKELIANDILVVQTGCSASTCAKSGVMTPEAMKWAGPGLQSICEAVGIPPVLHAGSCVDNSRILVALAEMVKTGGLGDDICDLPAVGAAPEWVDVKALAIGQYFVDYGAKVVFRPHLPIDGSTEFTKYLTEEYESVTGGRWVQTKTPGEMAEVMMGIINQARENLGINKKQERVLFDMAMRRELGKPHGH